MHDGREDRRRWLDEQYRLYTELMTHISEAVHATRTAYSVHPAYPDARRDEALSAQLVEEARTALRAVSPALHGVALMDIGHLRNR